ncbi:MAG: LysR family transcriptional regulator [Bacteroidales bacterium]|nr:LysR family transcriptional regulator [Bacteroidales bacterium]MBP5521799.1 LysR family transcriptional regulator [Bacteroidales bacterium]
MITDNRLKFFVAVAQSGSFTLAARKLGCSQPAVSQNIAQLESETGCTLFERGRGSVSLTPSGRIFYAYAGRILSLYESMARELSGQPAGQEPVLIDLGEGRSAEISVKDGKIQIGLNSVKY